MFTRSAPIFADGENPILSSSTTPPWSFAPWEMRGPRLPPAVDVANRPHWEQHCLGLSLLRQRVLMGSVMHGVEHGQHRAIAEADLYSPPCLGE